MASRPNSGLFLLNKLFQMWLKWNMPETKYVSFKKHLTWSNFKDFGGLLGIETCLWKLNFIDFETLVIFLFHKILKFLLTTVFQGWVLQCMRMHQNDVFLDVIFSLFDFFSMIDDDDLLPCPKVQHILNKGPSIHYVSMTEGERGL